MNSPLSDSVSQAGSHNAGKGESWWLVQIFKTHIYTMILVFRQLQERPYLLGQGRIIYGRFINEKFIQI